jgi:hypothetical protein
VLRFRLGYGWWWVGKRKPNLYKYSYIYIFMMKKKMLCPFCEGTKYVPAEEGEDVNTCPDCKGKGFVYP